MKESLEFAESERAILLDSNAELESQLKTLRTDLEKSRSALQQARYEVTVDLERLGSQSMLFYPLKA